MAAGETPLQRMRVPQRPNYLTKHTCTYYMFLYRYFEYFTVLEEYVNKYYYLCST